MDWGTQPVVVCTPVLCYSVDSETTGREELRVEFRNLVVKVRGKSINRMGRPFLINHTEYAGVQTPVILVYEPTKKVSTKILLTG